MMPDQSPSPLSPFDQEPGIFPAMEEPPEAFLLDVDDLPSATRGDRLVRAAAKLRQMGVSHQKVTQLLLFDLERVERQLAWFPYRSARKKASLIVAAIENDYEAPANLPAHEN